ncbi:hypothetical protein [Caballeronia temeraria]|uniref:hypothetical protein n=1 Tax=Caballeronia temeraria TaxID=1777137 RepID=UPI001FC9C146|nr:hypothetical protein [Caballeronia temeraria]
MHVGKKRFDELIEVVHLFQFATAVLIHLAVTREDVEFLQQFDRLAWANLVFGGGVGCARSRRGGLPGHLDGVSNKKAEHVRAECALTAGSVVSKEEVYPKARRRSRSSHWLVGQRVATRLEQIVHRPTSEAIGKDDTAWLSRRVTMQQAELQVSNKQCLDTSNVVTRAQPCYVTPNAQRGECDSPAP